MSDLSQLFSSSLPIEVKPSKARYALLILICFGVLATALVTLTKQERVNWQLIVLCIASTIGVMACLYALCNKRPLALLEQRGVTVRGWKGCPVPWTEIDRVWKFEQQITTGYSSVSIDYVCMALNTSAQRRDDQGSVKGKVASYFNSQGYGDLYFATKGMNFSADELVAAIQSHIGGMRLSGVPALVRDSAAI